MPVRNNFAAGEVLAAADLNDTFAAKVDYATPTNAQSGTGASAYTFVLADAQRLTTATGTSAKTFTIPPQSSVVWVANSIIRVANYGAGDLTIAGGSGVTVTNATKTLAQFESAALIRTASNAWTLVPFSGGVGNADFSDAASGTYSDSGINYKWIQFTASGTLTVTKAGFADVLVVGGGAGGGTNRGGGGGAGGHLYATDVYLPAQSLTVTIGAGGAGSAFAQEPGIGFDGVTSRLHNFFSEGGGGGGSLFNYVRRGQPGASGGGGGGTSAITGGTGTPGLGNNGGTSDFTNGGGGGGAGGAGGLPTGGAGLANSITGSSVTRSVGGTGNAGTAGGANTGNGGGGGAASAAGANGGSGIVIIRVRT